MEETNYLKIIIYVVVFILLIVISVGCYNRLTQDYETQGVETEEKIEKATGFSVVNQKNETVKLYDFRGKPVVVNFWATWCGPCKVELPAFERLYKKYGEQVQFMMVNLTDGAKEKKEDVEAFVTKNKYKFPVFFDTKRSAYNAYSLYSIPKTIFVDAKGNLIKSHTGAMSESTIESYIKLLLGE